MRILFIVFFLVPVLGRSQTVYKTGDDVTDMPIAKMLNHTSSSSTLKKIQQTITIIDFFGTWCAPCIKALPELAAYKNKFKDDISILLVSTEAEAKLTKFISTRQPFAFPIVVDEDNRFTNAFNPPSYPYTVVLDQNLKVLLITNAADLTEAALAKFIEAAKAPISIEPAEPKPIYKPKTLEAPQTFTQSNNALVKLSQEFMYAAKTNEPVAVYVKNLQELNYNELLTGLKTDDDKKAFWINLYNAYTNVSLHANPGQYKSRNRFFKNKNIVIAGKSFSLDKIEHDILRRGKIKWSLGYLSKCFPTKTDKELRVKKLDNRIHFGLNCGAKSCPPIAFYDPENLNKQLEIAANAYLFSEISYDTATNVLQLPAILSWFRRDFGGKQKIVELLKSKQLLAAAVTPKIRFKKYDWTLYLDNYKQ
jgi:thiol-disulfide isomerase/thioredoxin